MVFSLSDQQPSELQIQTKQDESLERVKEKKPTQQTTK